MKLNKVSETTKLKAETACFVIAIFSMTLTTLSFF